MIKQVFLFPQYYVHKQPICDDCGQELFSTGITLVSNPPLVEHICKKCGKTYNISETDLRGEWKWRTM